MRRISGLECFPVHRTPQGQWLETGQMITARANFTTTDLRNSQAILIVGGTADGSAPLASYEIYNVSTGCFKQMNMTYARMKHTATYFNQSDFVLVIGGQGSTSAPLAPTELVGRFGQQLYKNISGPRYSHATSPLINGAVYIIAGRGQIGTTDEVEVLNCIDQNSNQLGEPIRRKRSNLVPFGSGA